MTKTQIIFEDEAENKEKIRKLFSKRGEFSKKMRELVQVAIKEKENVTGTDSKTA